MSDGTIAGQHGLKVSILWTTLGDLIPTYQVVSDNYRDYNAIIVRHPTYADLLDLAGPPLDDPEDITCDVSGLSIKRGRNSIADDVAAGVLNLTINDPTGYYDPRRLSGVQTRVGARISVQVDPNFAGEWFYLFVGFIETWSRAISAESSSAVSVSASDAFHILARTRDTPTEPPVGLAELSGARIERYLTAGGGGSRWGEQSIDTGTVTMNATAVDNDLLAECHRVKQSEDGMFDVAADGTIRFRQEGWRDRHFDVDRNGLELAVIDNTGLYDDDLAGRPVICPVSFVASDDDLDIVNRVIVSRQVRFDPDLPGGGKPEAALRKAEDTSSASKIGLQSRTWSDLPHQTDTRSQVLADRWVDRYSWGSNRVGNVVFNLTKRPEDAEVAVIADWGDRVQVLDIVYGAASFTYYEVVSLNFDITPDDWRWTLGLDVWTGPLPEGTEIPRWDFGAWDVAKWVGSPARHGKWGSGRWGRTAWGGTP